jgi:hypothetical protein
VLALAIVVCSLRLACLAAAESRARGFGGLKRPWSTTSGAQVSPERCSCRMGRFGVIDRRRLLQATGADARSFQIMLAENLILNEILHNNRNSEIKTQKLNKNISQL